VVCDTNKCRGRSREIVFGTGSYYQCRTDGADLILYIHTFFESGGGHIIGGGYYLLVGAGTYINASGNTKLTVITQISDLIGQKLDRQWHFHKTQVQGLLICDR